MFYDAPGRLVRTDLPDGTFSRVVYSPWQVASFDANDTVVTSEWYRLRGAPDRPEPGDLGVEIDDARRSHRIAHVEAGCALSGIVDIEVDMVTG